jgi:hypothetical protein
MYSRLKVRTLIETKHFMMFELVGRAIWVERPDLLFRALWSLAEKKLFSCSCRELVHQTTKFSGATPKVSDQFGTVFVMIQRLALGSRFDV